MIYRGPGILEFVWFGSSPIPFPPSCSAFCVPPVELPNGRRGRGVGWTAARKPGPLKIIQYSLVYTKENVGPLQQREVDITCKWSGKSFFTILGVRNKMWIVIENLPPSPKKTNQNYLNKCETVFFAKLSVYFWANSINCCTRMLHVCMLCPYTVKKKLAVFPSPAGMSRTKVSLAEIN